MMRAVVWWVLCLGLSVCNGGNSGGEGVSVGNGRNNLPLAVPVLLTPANPIESATLPWLGLVKRDNPLLVMLSANNLARLGSLP